MKALSDDFLTGPETGLRLDTQGCLAFDCLPKYWCGTGFGVRDDGYDNIIIVI